MSLSLSIGLDIGSAPAASAPVSLITTADFTGVGSSARYQIIDADSFQIAQDSLVGRFTFSLPAGDYVISGTASATDLIAGAPININLEDNFAQVVLINSAGAFSTPFTVTNGSMRFDPNGNPSGARIDDLLIVAA